jgi:peptide/nickel transport system permease protein
MVTFILRRIVSGVVVLFVVSTMTFFLLYFSAPNVARNLLGESASQVQVHEKEVELGLDQPLVQRYFEWLGNALHGNFGTSWFTSQPVVGSIATRLPTTLSIVLVTIVIAAALAALVGIGAAVKRGWIDRVLQLVSIAGSAVPEFVIAILIVTVFAIKLHWFPATGYVALSDNFGGWVASITLPVVALVITMITSTAQQLRSATINVLSKDYVRTLRSRGLPFREILLKHVLRGAAPAALTILSLHFIGILGGVVIIEQIFSLPGMGFLAVQSTVQGDMPVLMGVIVYIVVIVVIVNLLVDLAVGWLNPKARNS